MIGLAFVSGCMQPFKRKLKAEFSVSKVQDNKQASYCTESLMVIIELSQTSIQ